MKPFNKTIAGEKLRITLSPPKIGDLLVFGHGGGFVIGIVVEHIHGLGTRAAWDDFEKMVPNRSGYFAQPSQLRKSAGCLVGRWFDTLDAAYVALREHRNP